jgi:hypothetical protein
MGERQPDRPAAALQVARVRPGAARIPRRGQRLDSPSELGYDALDLWLQVHRRLPLSAVALLGGASYVFPPSPKKSRPRVLFHSMQQTWRAPRCSVRLTRIGPRAMARMARQRSSTTTMNPPHAALTDGALNGPTDHTAAVVSRHDHIGNRFHEPPLPTCINVPPDYAHAGVHDVVPPPNPS